MHARSKGCKAALLLSALSLLNNVLGAAPTSAPPSAAQVLLISDIHFDPMVEPAQIERLLAAPPSEWPALLATSRRVDLPVYRNDTNWWLLTSALSYMKSTAPKPAFILITGDFMAHDFEDKFKQALPHASARAFRDFVQKTMTFVTRQLQDTFPGTPIIAALGNNDNDGADYALASGGFFLRMTGPLFRSMTLQTADADFAKSWLPLGCFSAHPPSLPGRRVLSVNTNFLSAKYSNPNQENDPGDQVLDWLESQLQAAEQSKEKVWMIYHVPPGLDGFATNRACRNGSTQPCRTVTMWQPRYQQRFESILTAHAAAVGASFAGHTHMDEFRLIRHNGAVTSFILLTPGISPSNGENPAFRKAIITPDGTLSDAETYYLDLATAANIEFPDWKPEYGFRADWGVSNIDARALESVYTSSHSDPDAGARWVGFYSVHHQSMSDMDSQTFRALHCAMGTIDADAFRQCYSGQ